MVAALMDKTGVAKKDVNAVLTGLVELAIESLAKKSVGAFKIHGLVQLRRIHKPATPARDGIHPFSKQPHHFSAKPAKNVVKTKALKAARDAVS
jgi:hypothetical protein